MHSLSMCKLCGKVFDPFAVPGNKGICFECLRKLDGMYSKIHDYLRDNKEDARFDPVYLSRVTNISLDNVKLLISMGYLERDMQTWSNIPSERRSLARKFESALERMKYEQKLTTYGGRIYSHKNTQRSED